MFSSLQSISFSKHPTAAYNIHVEDFMNRNIKYIWNSMTFQELKATLKDNPKIRSFPLVANPSKFYLFCLSESLINAIVLQPKWCYLGPSSVAS